MQSFRNILTDNRGDISLLNVNGYTNLHLSEQHAFEMLELDRALCSALRVEFDFEFVTASNTLVASNIAKTSFFENLPSKPFYIDSGENHLMQTRLLNPSVCYHCFDHYGRKYKESTQLLSSVAKCFRNEEITKFDPYRLCEFTMREFVVIGEEEKVREIGIKIFNKVSQFINELVPVERVNACDSFMGKNVEVLKKVQKAFELKQELIFQSKYGPVSTASVNWHKKTMTSKYIERENIESCCIAIGLERLYLGALHHDN